MTKEPAHDDKVPIYVTSMGHRYIKVDELLQSKRVQKSLKEMSEIAKKQRRKQVSDNAQD